MYDFAKIFAVMLLICYLSKNFQWNEWLTLGIALTAGFLITARHK